MSRVLRVHLEKGVLDRFAATHRRLRRGADLDNLRRFSQRVVVVLPLCVALPTMPMGVASARVAAMPVLLTVLVVVRGPHGLLRPPRPRIHLDGGFQRRGAPRTHKTTHAVVADLHNGPSLLVLLRIIDRGAPDRRVRG